MTFPEADMAPPSKIYGQELTAHEQCLHSGNLEVWAYVGISCEKLCLKRCTHNMYLRLPGSLSWQRSHWGDLGTQK